MDPYDVLGLVRDATPAEINRAYREKAKTVHPDGGGSDEDFQMLRLAYDTLRDPKRRKTYDETGRIDESRADNAHAPLLQYLAQIIAMLIQHMGDVPADTGNPIQAMRDLINEETRRVTANIEQMKAQVKYIETILKRMKRKKKAKPNPLLETVLQGTVAQGKAKLEGEAAIQKMRDTILEVLDGYDYEVSPIIRPEEDGIGSFFDISGPDAVMLQKALYIAMRQRK